MPHLTQPILLNGPLLECLICISQPRQEALKRAKAEVPAPISVRALVDTGASCTCVDPQVIKSLGLSPLGTAQVHTPTTKGTAQNCGVYDAAIIIRSTNGNLSIGTLPIVETHLSSQGFELIMGRNVLSKCILVYDGTSGYFTLSF
jgi:predicted aspartyl protease